MKNTFANMAIFFVMLMLVFSCSTGGFDELEDELDIVGPEVEGPEVEKPEVEGPEVEGPEVEGPEVEGPEVKEPEVKEPEVEGPEVKEPDVEGPEVKEPEVEKPEVKEPEAEKPEIEKPEVEGPDVEEPEDKEPEDKGPGTDESENNGPEDGKVPETEVRPPQEKNDGVPDLLINELYFEYNKGSNYSEFIEFKVLSDGNLGGLRVFVESNNEPMIFTFPLTEVKAEEYVVLHLRSEGGRYISEDAHNFRIPDSKSKLLRKTDAVYVLDQDDKVLNAVMIFESNTTWAKNRFQEVAEFLFKENAWKSPEGGIGGHADAVNSAGFDTDYTKSISRDENAANTNTAADWFVTIRNGVTSGQPNSPRP
jgi:hypothetical protein